MYDTVESIFSADGLLAKMLARYEARPQQVEMAESVWHALQADKRLVVEAATGTGKTMAYMIPAILSGHRVIVSTATKALQEQIFFKDIPFLQDMFMQAKPKRKFRAIYLKGRTNYLCKLRFEMFQHNIAFRSRKEVTIFSRIRSWSKKTKTGDRSEIKGMPKDYGPWSQITASGQQCIGAECKFYQDCFVTRIRREAKEADLIVVNHHLFFADLALREANHAEILPEYDAVIFDEAHRLEEIIASFFGTQVSNYRINELVQDVRRDLENEKALSLLGKQRLDMVERSGNLFFESLSAPAGRFDLAEVLERPAASEAKRCHDDLYDAFEELGDWLEHANAGELSRRLRERCEELRDEINEVFSMQHDAMVYMVERRGRGVFLEAVPLDVAALFRRRMLKKKGTQVYTSATLTAGGDFDFFLRRLGMDGVSNVDTLRLEAVFDYAPRALIYVPRRLPAPTSPGFVDGVCQIVEYLINTTKGRAFVLFTSYRNMELVHDRMKVKLDFPLLKQGDAPNQEILELFRNDVSSVLFATHSFWEGVDVQGEALSLVIIDKLPFASPTDPLMRARMEHLENNGHDAFRYYSIPSAAITLRQGFGRLIRSHQDQGVVAILDSRLSSRGYGKFFLNSLPPAPVVWNAKEVRTWWEKNVEPKENPEGTEPTAS